MDQAERTHLRALCSRLPEVLGLAALRTLNEAPTDLEFARTLVAALAGDLPTEGEGRAA